MKSMDISIRPGRRDDAAVLAELINYAGEGLPLHLWAKMAGEGGDAWSVGRGRAARDDGGFSYRNATIVECDGRPVAGLIGYETPDEPEPVPSDMPAMFVPLQELENLAPATWYVNALAALPDHRNRGLGGRLLAAAEEISIRLAKRGLSVIVSDANPGARRLYERAGYREAARRRLVKGDWVTEGREWVLLVKSF